MFVHLLHKDPTSSTSTTVFHSVFPVSSIKRIYVNPSGFAVVVLTDYDANTLGTLKQTLATWETLAVIEDRLASAHSTGMGKPTSAEVTAASSAASTGTPSTPDGD